MAEMLLLIFFHDLLQTSSCFNSTESYPYESLDETTSSSAQTPLGPGPGPPGCGTGMMMSGLNMPLDNR